jgi:hypothetical protein
LFEGRDEEVSDVEWLERCGRDRLVVLTKDKRLRHRRTEIAAVRRFRVKAFVLTAGSLRATEQAQRFLSLADAIDAACVADGPFVYSVQTNRIMRVFPP